MPNGQILCNQPPEDNIKDVLPFSTTIRPNQLETAGIIFSLAILVILLYLYVSAFLKKRISAHTAHHRLVQEIKDVLHPRSVSVVVLLKERAEANQRLVRAFHISNTFVSSDPDVHKTFVAQAQHLIKTAQCYGWAHFQAIAIDAVQWQLSQNHDDHHLFSPQSNSFKFDSFVQNVTLIVVLVGILQVDKPIQSFSYKDVTLVASRITTLWASSKKSDPIPPALLEELTTHLRRLVVDEAQSPNPLDFVIPTWETLWRVVATTIAHSYSDKEIRKAFKEFNTCPSDHSFRGGDQASEADVSVSVKAVVSEAMRLHPPSKHIGRSKSPMWWPRFLGKWIQPGIVTVKRTADVEKLLRCNMIWGPDADEFKPSRHSPHLIRPDQIQALKFGFGYGPLRCIATSWAPTAAGVISGAILDELDISGYILEAGAVIGGREGWNGWMIDKIGG